jgi:hypothetical protein
MNQALYAHMNNKRKMKKKKKKKRKWSFNACNPGTWEALAGGSQV